MKTKINGETMRKILVLFITLVISVNSGLAQKNEILDTKITNDNLITLSQGIIENDEFSKDEIEAFSKGITRIGVFRDSLQTMTVADVITSQKRHIRGLYASNLLRIAARVEMVMNTEFNYVGISPQDEDEKQLNMIIYEIKNMADNAIVRIEGTLTYYNQANQIVKIFRLRTSENINPDEKKRIGQPFIHNSENERDIMLRESNNLKVVWNPVYLEYSDGEKLGKPFEETVASEPEDEPQDEE